MENTSHSNPTHSGSSQNAAAENGLLVRSNAPTQSVSGNGQIRPHGGMAISHSSSGDVLQNMTQVSPQSQPQLQVIHHQHGAQNVAGVNRVPHIHNSNIQQQNSHSSNRIVGGQLHHPHVPHNNNMLAYTESSTSSGIRQGGSSQHQQHPVSHGASWSVPNPLGSLSLSQQHSTPQLSQIPTSRHPSNLAVGLTSASMQVSGINHQSHTQTNLDPRQVSIQQVSQSQSSQHSQLLQQQQHQLRLQQERQQSHYQQQKHQILQQQQRLAQHPSQLHQSGATVTTMIGDKPKVVLSNEAKHALAKAIWSAIKSPHGEIDPHHMQAALQSGLPRNAILNAAKVAREREATKRHQLLQQPQQQQHQQIVTGNTSSSISQSLASYQQVSQVNSQSSYTQLTQQHYNQDHQHHTQHQQQLLHMQQQKQQLQQQQQTTHQQQVTHQQQAAQQLQAQQATLEKAALLAQQQRDRNEKQIQIQQQQKKLQQQQKQLQHQLQQQKVAQQQQIQQQKVTQQQQMYQQKLAQQQAVQEKITQQQEEIRRRQEKQQREDEFLLSERSSWQRTHSGIFMNQKGRFGVVPHSLGAIIRCRNTEPVLRPPVLPSYDRKRAIETGLDIQKALRRRIAAGASYTATDFPAQPDCGKTTTTQLLDPDKYRRSKIEPKKFAKALDRVARKSRQSVSESLNKQYKDLNKAIANYQQEFFKFHRQRKADVTKLAKAIRDSFEKEEKKKEKDVAQAERARLAALKANDMTAYSKLLEDTKNDRLQFLLDKTEKSFAQISSTLIQNRTDDDLTSNDVSNVGPSSYYASAHMFSEEVRQPSILVGGDLKEYQLSGLQWMVSLYNNKLNGILADEMGLGKTIQAISLIAYLMEFKQNLGPFLVIVPLSTLSNWEGEFSKWCPAARTISYKGLPNQRKEIYRDQVRSGQFNVLLTTYEYIIRDKNVLRKTVWQYAIVDEGHRMKNSQSKFAVTLASQYTTKYRILLTGTPLMNDLSELWSLLNFLLPTIFNSITTFDQWFSAPFASFAGTVSDDTDQNLLSNEERVLIIHRLHELLRPFMLRRVKSEVLDQLPEKVEKVLRCDLSSWQKELYRQISKKVVAESNLLGDADTAPSRGFNNIIMQLRKVCNHPFLFSPDGYHLDDVIIRSSGKLALLDQMLPKLKAAGHRILLFTQMTQVMTILEDYFAFRGYLSLRLDGSTSAEEREKRMYRFNSPDSPYFIFLLSTRAGGLGLNLTAADTVIIFDSDWNPMQDLQAQDRAHRIGQRSDVSVFRLCSNSPVEEKILSRATEKLNVAELVVESGKFNKDSVEGDHSLDRMRLMEILLTDFNQSSQPKSAVDNTGSDDEDGDDAGSDSSEKEDLNELLSNNEADYQLYTAFDIEQTKLGIFPAPVFTKDEDIPDWIRYPPVGSGAGAGIFTSVADGSIRKRKEVAYDDGLTEKQFMRMMDKKSVDEEHARKKMKTSLSKSPRGRKKGVSSSSVVNPHVETSSLQISTNSDLTDWTFRKLISCGKSVVALKDPSTKRRLSDIFLEKPDPATFPDYYELIEKPIAINDILRKCRAKLYNNILEFKDDWKLMFKNAKQFNGEGWVVEDARALDRELERVMKKYGFVDDLKPPTSKATVTKKLVIKISLKGIKKNTDNSTDYNME